jgi:hypothetical protein
VETRRIAPPEELGEVSAPAAEVEKTPTLSLEVLTRGRGAVQFVIGSGLIGRSDPLAATGDSVAPEIDLWDDDAVSRRHARVEVRHGRYWLIDLNSTNGTLHNGRRLMPGLEAPLEPGDEIEVGACSLIRVLNTSRDAELSEEDLLLGKMLDDAMALPFRSKSGAPFEPIHSSDLANGDDMLELVLERGEAEGLMALSPAGKQQRAAAPESGHWRLHDPLGAEFPF